METTQPIKRPTGMTILLVLSFINACWNIFRNLIMYFGTPKMAEMIENGQFEETIAPILSGMNEEMKQSMMESMSMFAQINPSYYLILMILFIASLIGVVMMLKCKKRGFHIYAIAQICMLIASSIFVYPKQLNSSLTFDLFFTAIFILLYYLYFKRLEMPSNDD